jgi:hypothetical protein
MVTTEMEKRKIILVAGKIMRDEIWNVVPLQHTHDLIAANLSAQLLSSRKI